MGMVQTSGIELYVTEVGSGAPLLLLHGLGSSARDWELQIPAWSPHYRLLAWDARGHGRSAKPPGPSSVPQMAADAAGLLRALNAAPAHVVGISMGGMTGLQLALDAPALVRSVTAINAPVDLVPRTMQQHWMLWQRLMIVRLFGMRGVGRFLAKRLFPHSEQAALRDVFVQRWQENDKRAYLAAMRGLVGWSVQERLHTIGCPVQFLIADQDPTPVTMIETAAARIPKAQVTVIGNSRHGSTADQPDFVNAAVLRFLAAQDGTAVPQPMGDRL